MSDFTEYFDRIEVPEAARERIDKVLGAFAFLSPQPIDRVFISNTTDSEGLLRWEDVWGFTKKYWLRARGFMYQFDVDISGYEQSIKYLGIQFEGLEFDPDGNLLFLNGTPGMNIELQTGDDLNSAMSAAGSNCQFLAEIVGTLVRPNLRSEVI